MKANSNLKVIKKFSLIRILGKNPNETSFLNKQFLNKSWGKALG